VNFENNEAKIKGREEKVLAEIRVATIKNELGFMRGCGAVCANLRISFVLISPS
jgi:hypothetical protein